MIQSDKMRIAREALDQIALAGMSGSGQESEDGMRAWHARQAWNFIAIAARAVTELDALAALAAPVGEDKRTEAPDDGELEMWRKTADEMLNVRNDNPTLIRRAAHLLQNAYLFCDKLRATPPAQAEPSDMVLVPREPTQEMIRAGCENREGPTPYEAYRPSEVGAIYADMIAAAPTSRKD